MLRPPARWIAPGRMVRGRRRRRFAPSCPSIRRWGSLIWSPCSPNAAPAPRRVPNFASCTHLYAGVDAEEGARGARGKGRHDLPSPPRPPKPPGTKTRIGSTRPRSRPRMPKEFRVEPLDMDLDLLARPPDQCFGQPLQASCAHIFTDHADRNFALGVEQSVGRRPSGPCRGPARRRCRRRAALRRRARRRDIGLGRRRC